MSIQLELERIKAQYIQQNFTEAELEEARYVRVTIALVATTVSLMLIPFLYIQRGFCTV